MRQQLLLVLAILLMAVVPANAQQNQMRLLSPEQAGPLALGVLRTLEQQGAKLPVRPLRASDGVYAIGLVDESGPLLIAVTPKQPQQATGSRAPDETVAMLLLRDMTIVNGKKPMPLSRLSTVIPGAPVRITLAFLRIKADETGRTLEVYSREDEPAARSPLVDVVTLPSSPIGLRWQERKGRRPSVDLTITLDGEMEGTIRLTPTAEKDRLPFPKEGSLRVGEPAPDFRLKSPDGSMGASLSQFRGKKPVVLIFGSYT